MDIAECYAVLELPFGASEEEITRAYKDLCKVWHPDRFTNNPELRQKAHEKLKKINEAYETLISGGAANSAEHPNDPDAVLHQDAECWYLSGDPRLRRVGIFEGGGGGRAAGIVVVRGGLAVQTRLKEKPDEIMFYPAHSVRWLRFQARRCLVNASDPEGITASTFTIHLRFRSDYYAGLFAKRVKEAFGLVEPMPTEKKPAPERAPTTANATATKAAGSGAARRLYAGIVASGFVLILVFLAIFASNHVLPSAKDSTEIEFFGIRDNGSRFVYVLDRSVSMTSHNAMRVAKAELTSSLQALTADQQFQIIFYNINPTLMHLGGDSKDTMYWASDVNRTLARQFISGITAELGTDHLPALRKAFELKPDVVFFLTDAGQPQLDRADREKIRQLNGGRARIHCIEFGNGTQLAVERSFMEKLATDNGGMYMYRDVTKLNE